MCVCVCVPVSLYRKQTGNSITIYSDLSRLESRVEKLGAVIIRVGLGGMYWYSFNRDRLMPT